jgi:hypothetical protein
MRTASAIQLLTLVLAMGLSSCVKSKEPSSATSISPKIPAAETGPYTVIGHLEHRDRVVTIKTGEQGTVYSVHNKDGKTLFENLTAEQLKQQSPDIHSFIEAAEAGSAGLIQVRPRGSELIFSPGLER